MNKKIIFFNVVYYVVVIGLLMRGRHDASSSLGYGYFIVIFLAIAAIALIYLLGKKNIHPKSLIDKIGVFTATPVLSIIGITAIVSLKEKVSSEWYFNKNNYYYMVRTFDNDKASGGKRIEYYKSIDTLGSKNVLENDAWVKDSTWVYLSKTGDTIKKINYKNNMEVK